jgi:hypothetical protein
MIKRNLIKGLDYITKSLWCSKYLTNSTSSKSIEQLGLSLQYRQIYQQGSNPLSFSEVGFRVHSQNEEDGILLYIFSLIGTTNKKCVEICAGDGIECNTANLIINHRWLVYYVMVRKKMWK